MTYFPLQHFRGVRDREQLQRQHRIMMVNANLFIPRNSRHHHNKWRRCRHHQCTASSAIPCGHKLGGTGSSSSSSSSCCSCSLPLLPQELQELTKTCTADFCPMLQRADFPLSVHKLGWMAFYQFTSLVQVSFGSSTSRLREISSCAFMDCRSLLVVSLPDSLERISYGAFGSCLNLTTVAISPFHNGTLRIQAFAFRKCESLSNLDLSDSLDNILIDQRAFEGCTRLQECLGSLVGRFEGFPIHKLCYQATSTGVEEFTTILKDNNRPSTLVDMFGMTPFHVLSSSAEPRRDLFQLLLQHYPSRTLGWKDANGKRAMDYLGTNYTNETAGLLELALQAWMFDPLESWGATIWSANMKAQVKTLLGNQDRKERTKLLRNASSQMENYERNETMTILELAVWNKELAENSKNATKAQDQHQRRTALNICGSCCVLSNVAPFLGLMGSLEDSVTNSFIG